MLLVSFFSDENFESSECSIDDILTSSFVTAYNAYNVTTTSTTWPRPPETPRNNVADVHVINLRSRDRSTNSNEVTVKLTSLQSGKSFTSIDFLAGKGKKG